MSEIINQHNSAVLQKIARQAMVERGLLPDFPPQVISEVSGITGPAKEDNNNIRDLCNLAWCSIDNDDSRDLDQLSFAKAMPGGTVKIYVAIADVDAIVQKHSAIDLHAQHNTTSVYTAAQIFPMLPEELSTDLTSLNYDSERLAIVIEMEVAEDGSLQNSDIYRANVYNKAKLTYDSVSDWLDGNSEIPGAIAEVSGLDENIKLQYLMAQKLKALRHKNGALNFDTIKARPITIGDNISDIEVEKSTSAKELIEDFMIAANGVTARYLTSKRYPSVRRVVSTPKRWPRIVNLASAWNYKLPEEPDSKELDKFLIMAKSADPIRFPDLSLSIIKLLGPGEYTIELPGGTSEGHFGLAVKDYSHSTAPNRRYPDLLTQRLLKAAFSKSPVPYTNDELIALAKHCTEAENAANKVERQVTKSATAIFLQSRIGEDFNAIVTGASDKGIWVRITYPPVEGKLVKASNDIDIGDQLRVRLVHVNVERGFIDFEAR